MMKSIKVSELTGNALNWAVAICEGYNVKDFCPHDQHFRDDDDCWFSPADDWAQGGPIIERELICLECQFDANEWHVWTPAPDQATGEARAGGETPLIAAMRCYVASKLGDTVQVPEEVL
jgi:hypothetical protein